VSCRCQRTRRICCWTPGRPLQDNLLCYIHNCGDYRSAARTFLDWAKDMPRNSGLITRKDLRGASACGN